MPLARYGDSPPTAARFAGSTTQTSRSKLPTRSPPGSTRACPARRLAPAGASATSAEAVPRGGTSTVSGPSPPVLALSARSNALRRRRRERRRPATREPRPRRARTRRRRRAATAPAAPLRPRKRARAGGRPSRSARLRSRATRRSAARRADASSVSRSWSAARDAFPASRSAPSAAASSSSGVESRGPSASALARVASRLNAAAGLVRVLAAHGQPLGCAPQPVEGGRGLLVPAGGLLQLLLGTPRSARTPSSSSSRRLRSCSAWARRPSTAARRSSRGATLPADRRARIRSISCTSFSARWAAVAWSASGRSRFRASSSSALALSTWIATRASFSSARWRRCLKLPSPAASSISARRSLGLGRQHLLHPSLADDRVHLMAEPGSPSSSSTSVRRTAARLIEVLPVAASMKPARDRELAVRQRPVTGGVVEDHFDVAVIDTVRPAEPAEEDVLRLLGPEGARSQAPGRPDDGVGDVRFPRAVRPDDDGHPRLEANLDRVRERLEAAQLDRAQVHARISDDGCGRSWVGRVRRVAVNCLPGRPRSSRAPPSRRPARMPSSKALCPLPTPHRQRRPRS